jgi:hypothetical protein
VAAHHEKAYQPAAAAQVQCRDHGDEHTVFHLHDDDLPPEALSDPMKPPEQPILVHCIHCNHEYDSWQMIWVPLTEEELKRKRGGGDLKGFWCCPVEGCGGAGFTCDIWPADPDYRDPETGEKYFFEDEPMIEGHEVECECVECEMARPEEEAEYEREYEELMCMAKENGHEEPGADGGTKPKAPSERDAFSDEDIPF